jgi:hypothetical protein
MCSIIPPYKPEKTRFSWERYRRRNAFLLGRLYMVIYHVTGSREIKEKHLWDSNPKPYYHDYKYIAIREVTPPGPYRLHWAILLI